MGYPSRRWTNGLKAREEKTRFQPVRAEKKVEKYPDRVLSFVSRKIVLDLKVQDVHYFSEGKLV